MTSQSAAKPESSLSMPSVSRTTELAPSVATTQAARTRALCASSSVRAISTVTGLSPTAVRSVKVQPRLTSTFGSAASMRSSTSSRSGWWKPLVLAQPDSAVRFQLMARSSSPLALRIW